MGEFWFGSPDLHRDHRRRDGRPEAVKALCQIIQGRRIPTAMPREFSAIAVEEREHLHERF